MRRGEVWESRLHPRSGAEQSGRRPVIVLSNDGFNAIESWQSVIVVPCSTSDKQRARGPTAVALKKGAGGLRKGSVALCHQITTIDRTKLVTRWGSLRAEEMAAVEQGLRAALDMS
ncbi:MAG: type II toxin-antitoxin system PemK/MazF family toxin [Deltaproteobacteria bacterium]|nr:type II toxin-antitoxin system PemK/MazF family toxin [Deltaproteobacteria bacterium]